MLNTDEVLFKKLNLSGLETLVSWAAAEGWNPGLHDAEIFYNTDPDGFYGYFYQDELIAGGSVVAYGRVFGFMGFFIVKPMYRSAGVGRKLWYQRRDTLLARLATGASIGMDGVVAMQPFYQKGGFNIAYRDERYEKTGEPFTIDSHISPVENEDLAELLKYDEACFGFSRPQFIIPWLHQPDAFTFKYTDQGQLCGFAILRKCLEGYKICPLFADHQGIAESLYQACLHAVKGEKVFIDIPVINHHAKDLVTKYQAKYVFECARMYYGKAPDMALEKIFGLTTFELG